jgi:tetratricopeptide (TPR) repeat protein
MFSGKGLKGCFDPNLKRHSLRLSGGIDNRKWDDLEVDPDSDPTPNLLPSSAQGHLDDIGRQINCKPETDFDSQEEEHDSDPDWQCNLGEMEQCAGRTDRAERAFLLALQKNRTHVQTLLSYGKLLGELGDFAGAEGMFSRVLDMNPDDEVAREALQDLCDHSSNRVTADAGG